MAERSSGNRWLILAFVAIVAIVGVGVAIGVWLPLDGNHQARDASGGAAVAPSPEPSSVPAQELRIAESGRISIEAASLRDGGVLVLWLGLGDEARGSAHLPVRVVSADGRRIETTALPAAGSGTGLRLELDPEWLRPGLYMIEVTTAEKVPLHLRRYAIEVR